ncbi:hypothetical protein PS1M3_04040 [Pseudoalteromonas sp. PS1M3]|nr:hypothetical protein [Pseudoalteromonas sp. PS1M3]BBW90317.1 hypothetical protein PS1M3_04040 [Pseudoalteromonas sp. PS1M3]
MNLKVGTPDMNEEPISNKEQLESIFITESYLASINLAGSASIILAG